MSLEAAARYACVSRDELRRAVCAGELPAFERPGQRQSRVYVRVHREDVDAWIRGTWRKVGPDTWAKAGGTRCA